MQERGKGESEMTTREREPFYGGRVPGAFEDLEIWQQGVDLAASVYAAFAQSRDLSFRDQVRRSAVSISSNIAEGFERGSNAEFVRFLYYAKGSCGELRSQIHLARRVGLLSDANSSTLFEEARCLSRRIGALINVRQSRSP
jgi:four helix bundle protein